MATVKKTNLFASEEGVAVRAELMLIEQDISYNTGPSYSADAVLHPDKLIPFVEKHMRYLNNHPQTNPRQYLANLRLMTKVRK